MSKLKGARRLLDQVRGGGLVGTGVDVSIGPRTYNVRALPRATNRTRLAFDLEIVGGWLAASGREIGFVQIGAFDGDRNDPLHNLIRRYGWKGVLVEPQVDAFARLKATYRDVDGLVFINAAVGDRPGTAPFYFVGDVTPQDPWWFGQIASFDRAHVISHLETHLPSEEQSAALARVTSRQTETITMTEVLGQAPRAVDVLQIDTEGYDANVVRGIDLTTHRPTVVRFENVHLSAADHQAAVSHLQAAGYRFAVDQDDTIAIRYTPGRGITAVE